MTDARNDRLVWIDLEMTGLSPTTDRIIEIAVVVTDAQITQRVEGPVLAVKQSDAALDAMDAWNKGTHGRSGLIERVRASRTDEATDTQREMVRRHEAALARYLARDFGEARAQWQALQDAPDAALHSELHAVWIKRCEQYLVSPPPADWDGVHTFETK